MPFRQSGRAHAAAGSSPRSVPQTRSGEGTPAQATAQVSDTLRCAVVIRRRYRCLTPGIADNTSLRLVQRERDASVVLQPEAGIVCDLPHVSIGISEDTGKAAVERLRRLSCDFGSVPSRQLDQLAYL